MWDWNWWWTPRADRIGNRIVRKASAGDIIVIHDGHHKNPNADRRHAAETITRIAPLLRARGFSFAPLCDADVTLPSRPSITRLSWKRYTAPIPRDVTTGRGSERHRPRRL